MQPSRAETKLRERILVIAEDLRETFAAEFAFWQRKGNTFRLRDDLCGTPEALDLPPLAFLAPLAARTNAVEVASGSDPGRQFVALRLPSFYGDELVASAQVKTQEPAMLRHLAQLFLRNLEDREAALRTQLENQKLLLQVTDDLEELFFLRSISELLAISDLSSDVLSMAESILPMLRTICDAECLMVLNAVADSSGAERESEAVHAEVDRVVLSCGEPAIDHATCRRLVEECTNACKQQPVVKNGWDKTAVGVQFPGVQSFVLVGIVNDQKTVGWLLALNRSTENDLPNDDLPWEVSSREFGTHEATLLSSSAAILATHARNIELIRERENTLVSVVRALVSAIETKDEYTRGHSERVALFGKRLGQELGLGADYCDRLYLTGLLHDVGKIGIRDSVLLKPGALTEKEFDEIKQHPEKGWAILQDLKLLDYVLPGVLHHHENVDGQGYPDRLAGDQIPLDGRILAIVDAFDAMTSDRPYRPGLPLEKAKAILRSGAGTQWDAELLEAFFHCWSDILEIQASYEPRKPPQREPGRDLSGGVPADQPVEEASSC